MENAQRAYDSRIQTDKISEQIKNLAQTLSAQDDLKEYSTQESRNNGSIEAVNDAYNEALLRTGRIKILLEYLPDKDAQESGRDAARLDDDLKDLESRIHDLRSRKIRGSSFEMDIVAAQDTVLAVNSDTLWTEEELIKDFSREAIQQTIIFKQITLASYVLFPLGLFIGVLGQIAGVKSVGSE
jgi:hypothetical protein